ncbi:hypothetical protein FDP41_010921 [Naegleria fowleri]|uniref:Uncharacterized protein n=1 Tax=Naegleria fowleri TaxID=5763 RepID=A0A6A5C7S2_NAEFO|nr:uncharacterized protein FDP41_010921 [Naegleria fowleri]KAF0982942.1 hypothetical protein FDP41_010921 [Naegleria fowleri]
MKCRQEQCTVTECTFDHQSSTNNSSQNRSINLESDTLALQKLPSAKPTMTFRSEKPCRYGDDCRNIVCRFKHKNRKKCNFLVNCVNLACTLDYSSLTNPSIYSRVQQRYLESRKQQEMIDDSSDDESDNQSTTSTESAMKHHFHLDDFSDTDSVTSVDSVKSERKVAPQVLKNTSFQPA